MPSKLDNYSREEIEKMCKTMSARQIAAHIGLVNQSRLLPTLLKRGFKPKSQDKSDTAVHTVHKDFLIKHHKDKSAGEIAMCLSVHPETVRQACKKLGLKLKSYVPSSEPLSKNKKSVPIARKKSPPKVGNAKSENPNKVKTTIINRAKDLDDIRNLMSRPIYNPSEKTISTRY